MDASSSGFSSVDPRSVSPIPDQNYQSGVIDWLNHKIIAGEAFLKKQHGFELMEPTIRLIMGKDRGLPRESGLSQTVDNEFGYIALQLAAAMTDVKPFWEYRSKNPKFQQQCKILGHLSYHWWVQRNVSTVFQDVIKMALAAGTGYMLTTWDPDVQDFISRSIHPKDVIPVEVTRYDSVQYARGMVVREEVPLWDVHNRWPDMAKIVKADRYGDVTDDDRTYAARVNSLLDASPMTRYREYLRRAVASFSSGTLPVVDLFTAYLKDYSTNNTDKIKLMGPWIEDASMSDGYRKPNWAYEVKPGERLYPFGRTIVCTRSAVLYDGPSQYWHGQFPLTKLTLDSWPFEGCYLGKSPLWDIIPLQQALNKAERAIEDHVEHMVEPDVVAETGAGISKSALDMMNSRKGGGKLQRRPGPGKGYEWQYPTPLSAEIIGRPQFLLDRMARLTGVRDLDSVMKLNQLPSSEAIERLMEASSGPIRMRSRNLEAFMTEFATQMAYNFIQYRTMAERIAVCGAEGATPEDFDYDPGELVPDHMGSDFLEGGTLNPSLIKRDPVSGSIIGISTRPKLDRAREFMRYFTFHIAPGSMLKSAKINEQLMYLQLFRAGIMDPWTLMEKLEIPNVGEPPMGGTTITERLAEAMAMGLTGQVSAAGRKSSGQEPPKTKTNGSVSESG